MNQRALRAGEIDQDIDVFQTGCHIVTDDDIGYQAHQFAGVLADCRAARHIKGGAERDALALQGSLDEHAAHAAAGSHDTNTCFAHS